MDANPNAKARQGTDKHLQREQLRQDAATLRRLADDYPSYAIGLGVIAEDLEHKRAAL